MTRGSQGRRSASLCCKKAAIALASSVCAFAAAASQNGAAAQQTVFVGQNSRTDVIVDLSAIDEATKNKGKSGSGSENANAATAQQSVTLTPPKLGPPSEPSGDAPIVLQPPGHQSGKKTAVANAPAAERATSTEAPASGFAPLLPTKPQRTATQKTQATVGSTPSSPSPPVSGSAGTVTAPASSDVSASATSPPQPPESPTSAPPRVPPAAETPLAADQTPPPPAAAAPAAAVASNAATTSASALGNASGPRGERALSVNFAAGDADLPENARNDLDGLAATLNKNGASRVQLLAYAAGTDEQASQVRRLSLNRALAVRKYLIDRGIVSSRIDVRALGNKFEDDGPPDRVDLLVMDK